MRNVSIREEILEKSLSHQMSREGFSKFLEDLKEFTDSMIKNDKFISKKPEDFFKKHPKY